MTPQSHRDPATAPREDTTMLRDVIGLLLLRVGLVAGGAVLVTVALAELDVVSAFPPNPMFSAIILLPVNIVCLVLVRRLLHARGTRVRDLVGYSRARLGTDVLWGMLWLTVLYVPFAATVVGVMALLHGERTFVAFETVFFDVDAVPRLSAAVALVLALIAVVTFAPLNAPAEELVYRGFAQGMLARRLPLAAAIVFPALVFGLQHVFYAPTADAVLVYAAAFTVWGLGSGLIYHRQGRLMPLIIAHGIVNLLTSLPALVIPFVLS